MLVLEMRDQKKAKFVISNTSISTTGLAQAVAGCMLVVGGGAATPAGAQAQFLYGGGATLPAPAYVGDTQATSHSRLTLPATSGVGSLFSVFEDATITFVQYCQTGSGTGRGVLEGLIPATGACGSFDPPVYPSGFSAANSLPDFAASDVPVGTADLAAAPTDNFAQTPTMAAAIAFIYHRTRLGPDAANLANLTTDQICGIFAGTLTDWSQLSSEGFSPGPISVVYRSDGSGTTFNVANYFAHNCNGLSTIFQTSQNFTAAPGSISAPVLAILPSNFIGANGNPAVVSTVTSMDGTIGYAETADAVAIEGASFKHFAVNGLDPVSNAPGTLNVTSIVNMGIDTNNFASGQPMLTSLSSPSECIFIVNPNTLVSASITSDDGAVGIIPPGQYPVVAVTYLLGYQAGNVSGHVSALRELFGSVAESSTLRPLVTTVTPLNGYSWLNLDLAADMSGCIN